jgi:NAD(P)-dependent dehydrogenase (short-subunit alcohol dehydrogenase family)
MAKVGFPAIQAPSSLELRSVQQLVDNIRERFGAVEALANNTYALVAASKSVTQVTALQAQITQLQQQLATFTNSPAVDALKALLDTQANGLVVLKDGALITRVLQAGENIAIVNPAGTAGDPLIRTAFTEIVPFTQEAWPWNDFAEDELAE